MQYKIIVAMDTNRGIGYRENIPWLDKYPEDLKHFYKTTIGRGRNAVIMGNTTYKSIGRPLSKRHNIIIRSPIIENINTIANINTDCSFVTSISDAINLCNKMQFDTVWIIGGQSIYEQFILNETITIDSIVISCIPGEYQCDKFFPSLHEYSLIDRKQTHYTVEYWGKK